jgi:hypothetical protein
MGNFILLKFHCNLPRHISRDYNGYVFSLFYQDYVQGVQEMSFNCLF